MYFFATKYSNTEQAQLRVKKSGVFEIWWMRSVYFYFFLIFNRVIRKDLIIVKIFLILVMIIIIFYLLVILWREYFNLENLCIGYDSFLYENLNVVFLGDLVRGFRFFLLFFVGFFIYLM